MPGDFLTQSVEPPAYDPVVAFNDLAASELDAAKDRIVSAVIDLARQMATEHLVSGPVAGAVNVEDALRILLTRDDTDERYELLSAFEKQWAQLVLQFAARTLADPSPAVRDARDRGVGVADIASALGISEQGVYKRYATEVVRRPRRATAQEADSDDGPA
jgi:hypothetical protein